MVSGEPFFDSERERIVGLAARYPMPTIYAWREYVLVGGSLATARICQSPIIRLRLCGPDFEGGEGGKFVCCVD